MDEFNNDLEEADLRLINSGLIERLPALSLEQVVTELEKIWADVWDFCGVTLTYLDIGDRTKAMELFNKTVQKFGVRDTHEALESLIVVAMEYQLLVDEHVAFSLN